MILHWLVTALRSLIANPLFSAITIASLSVGCAGALLAGANIKQHLSFERHLPHADHIFLARMRDDPAQGTMFASGRPPVRDNEFPYELSPAVKPAIEGRVPGMAALTRLLTFGGSPLLDKNGESIPGKLFLIEPDFFDVFNMEFVEGNPATALAAPLSIILTQSKAKQIFGGEPALGKEVPGTEGRTFRISAVVKDPPPTTHLRFDMLASLLNWSNGEVATMRWGSSFGPGSLYIRAADDVDRDTFMATANAAIKAAYTGGMMAGMPEMNTQLAKEGLPLIKSTDVEIRVSLLPITDIHLSPHDATGIFSIGDVTMLMTLGGVAGALLAVSAFNYVILSLARALRRRREVGVRKVLGASGGAVTRQYLAEAGLVTLISVALGFGVAELLHNWFARALGQDESMFNLYDPIFLAGALGGFLLLAILVGAYPALYLAHIRPRAGLASGGDEGVGGIGRSITAGLLGLEIAAATVLLAVGLTMAEQARYVAARPLGFKLAGLYAITTGCGRGSTREHASANLPCSAALDRAVRDTPGITAMAYSSNPSILTDAQPMPITRPGGNEPLGNGFPMSVDAGFLPIADAKLLAGRLFDANSAFDRRLINAYPTYPAEPFDSVPVVITRATLPVIGAATPEAAIGQRIMIGTTRWAKSYEIVGVIEDWHQRSLRHAVSPIVFIPGGTMMMVIAEIADTDLPSVQEKLTLLKGFATGAQQGNSPEMMKLTVTPLQTAFEKSYDDDRKLMGAVTGFAGLAMLVAGMGVYGLSAFDMRRRVREIGIRKALGATPAKVAGMVLRQQVLFAGISSMLSWPIAYWLSNGWLEQYVYRTSLGPVVLPVASAIVVGFVALAVGLNTARAAAIRPSFALRTAA
ncbi:MAG TPA: FtsX-like permease family protein [Hyphomonadaceae bacterium]|jgi:putative ABC transport system permease protein|nr:FtsX-like permease family protein [Hyphomonadaceae bacterium]